MEKAFEFKQVVKTFPGFRLGPLDFSLRPGSVLGYIGPNGAGKTTTMQCLVGLLKADSGAMSVFGRANDPYKPAWKQDIGYVGDAHVFYERWSAAKNLKFVSQFYPNWSDQKAMALAKRFRLPLEKRAKNLSTGNRVKLSLVSAMAHSPKLLLLDEPTAGLDPVVRSELLDELFEVLQDGERAIFYSTHNLADINRLVDELAFIDEGEIILRKPKTDLMDQWQGISFTFQGQLPDIDKAVKEQRERDRHRVMSSDIDTTLAHLQRLGAGQIETFRLTLDEIAVQIIKRGKKNDLETH
jgi:ABC-2 type transport system ATP-binding protein